MYRKQAILMQTMGITINKRSGAGAVIKENGEVRKEIGSIINCQGSNYVL